MNATYLKEGTWEERNTGTEDRMTGNRHFMVTTGWCTPTRFPLRKEGSSFDTSELWISLDTRKERQLFYLRTDRSSFTTREEMLSWRAWGCPFDTWRRPFNYLKTRRDLVWLRERGNWWIVFHTEIHKRIIIIKGKQVKWINISSPGSSLVSASLLAGACFTRRELSLFHLPLFISLSLLFSQVTRTGMIYLFHFYSLPINWQGIFELMLGSSSSGMKTFPFQDVELMSGSSCRWTFSSIYMLTTSLGPLVSQHMCNTYVWMWDSCLT